MKPIVIITAVTALLFLPVYSYAGSSWNKLSISFLMDAQAVGMTNYGNAKASSLDVLRDQMWAYSSSIGASSQWNRKATYPTAFGTVGFSADYLFHPRWNMSLKYASGSSSGNDFLNYLDSAGDALNINYDWKMAYSQVAVGAGYNFEGMLGKRNSTVFRLYGGMVSLTYTEKGTFYGNLVPAGGTSLSQPINYSQSYSKTYFEPSITTTFFFDKNHRFGISAQVAYIAVASETIGGVPFDISGPKLGVGLGMNLF